MSENQTPDIARPPRFDPWSMIADTLRRHPRVWHRIDGDSTTGTTNIETGVLVAFRPAGAFKSRRVNGALEIQFVGTPERI